MDENPSEAAGELGLIVGIKARTERLVARLEEAGVPRSEQTPELALAWGDCPLWADGESDWSCAAFVLGTNGPGTEVTEHSYHKPPHPPICEKVLRLSTERYVNQLLTNEVGHFVHDIEEEWSMEMPLPVGRRALDDWVRENRPAAWFGPNTRVRRLRSAPGWTNGDRSVLPTYVDGFRKCPDARVGLIVQRAVEDGTDLTFFGTVVKERNADDGQPVWRFARSRVVIERDAARTKVGMAASEAAEVTLTRWYLPLIGTPVRSYAGSGKKRKNTPEDYLRAYWAALESIRQDDAEFWDESESTRAGPTYARLTVYMNRLLPQPVAERTIRRELKKLEKQGLIRHR